MHIPLHKRDVLGYLVGYVRKINELRTGAGDSYDIVKVFAPLIFRSSSNYNSRDNKMKIPKPLDDEIKFLQVLVHDLDVQEIHKKGSGLGAESLFFHSHRSPSRHQGACAREHKEP